jgi:subtilase family serine protease
MESSHRRSWRLRPDSLEVLEGRALLSALPVHHPHPLPATAHPSLRHAPLAVARHSPTGDPGHAHPLLLKVRAGGSVRPLVGNGPSPSALTPAQTRHIYGIDRITYLGYGQTIAIVDAYDDPNILSDADTFDKQFMTTLGGSTSYYTAYGASSTWLTKAYPSGTRPTGNTGWGQEISLDVEWAHAIAPRAKILLVEANSNGFSDLLAADDYAVSHGATVISNSWGGGEFSGENSYDSHFSKAHGVSFVFSAGDGGNQEYPAESPYVLSVGGTTLSHDSNSNWTNEVGWSSGGGGTSLYESKPSYQKNLSYARRSNPDIAYDADPNSGFAVYDSYGGYGWNYIFGGTSAGAPQWSALIALADQGRVAAKKSVLDGYTQTLPAIYAMTTGTTGNEQINDVTSGRNRVGSAGPGFDLVTGRGTPRRADLVYQALVNY